MKGDVIIVEEHHRRAAARIAGALEEKIRSTPRVYTITVAGESGAWIALPELIQAES